MLLKSNIQQLRIKKNLSRPQLADAIGMSWETVKAYETKGAKPSLPVAFKIAKVLDCTVDDLFELDDENVNVEEYLATN